MTDVIDVNNSDHAHLLQQNSLFDKNDCVICLEDVNSQSSYVFDCSHILHVKCFHKYFLYNYDVETNFISCPVCRTKIDVEIQPKYVNKCAVYCKYFVICFGISSIGLSFFPFDKLLKY